MQVKILYKINVKIVTLRIEIANIKTNVSDLNKVFLNLIKS